MTSTKDDLIECVKQAVVGESVCYVVRNGHEARYCVMLVDQIGGPIRRRVDWTYNYAGGGELRIMAATFRPDRLRGWQGNIVFNYAWGSDLRRSTPEVDEWMRLFHAQTKPTTG